MHEKEVIERIRARDEGGIEALLTYFGPLMRYVIAPILPNDADREECLSECCMKVWDGIERFKPESGSWTAPAGVTQLRVIIAQGGQGSSPGQDGYVGGSGNLPGSGVAAGEGQPGVAGQGGKIWYGTININPQQVFEVTIGQGGAPSTAYGTPGSIGGETTFGSYSSANGHVYPLGFTDVASGNSYARTGVQAPVNGTGDGAAGGTGGRDWILGVNVIKIFKIISKARIIRLTFAEKCAIIFLSG